jgi:hypothetical protein
MRISSYLKLATLTLAFLTAVLTVVGGYLGIKKTQMEISHTTHTGEKLDRLVRDSGNGYLERQPEGIREAVREIRTAVRQRGMDIEVATTFEYTLLDATADDYALGRYRVEDVAAAEVTLRFLREIVLPSLSHYIGTSPVQMRIIGSADGTPVREDAAYRGDLGSIQMRYTNAGSEDVKAVSLHDGDRLSNEKIALLRAYAAYDYLEGNEFLTRSPVSFVAVTDSRKGGKFRRVEVVLCIPHALEESVRDLSLPARTLLLRNPEFTRASCDG